MKPAKLFILLVMAAPLAAKEHDYQRGVLMKMESSKCGFAENGSKTMAGEILGTDGQHQKTQDLLCQEYTLQSDRVVYRIRPRDDKHPALLPVGETAQFRLDKDKMMLKVAELDNKEHEYIVVSMTPRADVASSETAHNSSH
ncbi:MAG TPA: hypothetical protein VFO34_10880 [Candidatus Acidoferrales bacterium]|nr:hypothetical protein [Candidatus Acidoferrales bacterium]